MITVNWMMICEYASASIDHKANLLGVFDELKCFEMPLNLSRIFVVLDMIFEDSVNGVFSVRISKYDRDLIVAVSEPKPISYRARGKQPTAMPFEFRDLVFPELGRYKVQVYLDDKVIHTGYLNLVQ